MTTRRSVYAAPLWSFAALMIWHATAAAQRADDNGAVSRESLSAMTPTCWCDPATTCNGHGTCNADGSCACKAPYGGANCNQCLPKYYNYPTCKYCDPSTTCNGHGSCSNTGSCTCAAPYTGTNCDQCQAGTYNYPTCKACDPSTTCNGHGSCGPDGNCSCGELYTGPNCDQCAAGRYDYPNCTYCDPATTCNGHGTCDAHGNCTCDAKYSGSNCEKCAPNLYDYPTCQAQPNSCALAPPALCATGRNNTAYVAGKNQGVATVLQIWRSAAINQDYSKWGLLKVQVLQTIPTVIEALRSSAWSDYTKCRAQGLIDGSKCELDTLNSADPCSLDGLDWGALSSRIYCDLQKAVGLADVDPWFVRPVYAPQTCGYQFQTYCEDVYRFSATEGADPLTDPVRLALAFESRDAGTLIQPSCQPFSTGAHTKVYEDSIYLDCSYVIPAPISLASTVAPDAGAR